MHSMNELARYWPLFGLRVITPRLEIRLPGDDDLVGLVDEIVAGIHDPVATPFTMSWTDVPSPQRERESLQWWWRHRAEWSPGKWNFTGAVFVDGRPVGIQDLGAENFAQLRTVETGSWLGMRHQGQGFGKEMRAAILHLAFAGLGAVEAYSGAWHDNPRSLGVSSALGYVFNGEVLGMRRDVRDRAIKLRLTLENWEPHRRDDISVEGLEPCLELFGAA
jgi:RimJ/RimL family protein N-acetyltransferase